MLGGKFWCFYPYRKPRLLFCLWFLLVLWGFVVLGCVRWVLVGFGVFLGGCFRGECGSIWGAGFGGSWRGVDCEEGGAFEDVCLFVWCIVVCVSLLCFVVVLI